MLPSHNNFITHDIKEYINILFARPFQHGLNHLDLAFGRPAVINEIAQKHLRTEKDIAESQTKVHFLSLKQKVYHFLLGIGECVPLLGAIVDLTESYFAKKQEDNLSKKIYSDPNNLMTGAQPFASHQHSWYLNLALLRSSYETANGARKDLIKFLAANYLAKVTPKKLNFWSEQLKETDPNYLSKHQGSPIEEYRYHRECLDQGLFYGKKINDTLPYGQDTLFILTDTTELDHFFPLRFTVIDNQTPFDDYSKTIKNTIKEHLQSHINNAWDNSLNHPFLFDVTDLIDNDPQTDPEGFKANFEKLKKEFEQAQSKAIDELTVLYPGLADHRKTLQEYIDRNTTCLSRVTVGESKGLKLLPLGLSSKESQQQSPLINFVVNNGLYIGSVNLRRTTDDVFEQRPDVNYGVTSKTNSPALYYKTKEAFIQTKLFQRLLCFYGSESVSKDVSYGIDPAQLSERVSLLSSKPHITVLGKATVDLLQGLFSEIDEKKWKDIQNDPVLCQIFQTSLFLAQDHLAHAEMAALSGNFNHFSQRIELVHAELATLLELTQPFKEQNFQEIYKKEIEGKSVPQELTSNLTAGLGKTGVNIFAGVASAAKKEGQMLQAVHSGGAYFEEVLLTKHDYDHFMNDPSLPKLDLYLGQFNPNIDVGSTLTEYKLRNVAADVKRLLDEDRVEENFTVAVDITIEEYHSENSRKLLEQFKEEIAAGKINFIFFSSGQKFYTLGMDGYYGAYFYAVNNGDAKWDKFKALNTHPAHRVDTLSTQWFCLATKYAADSLSKYRSLIFQNSRYILDHIPSKLNPGNSPDQKIRVNGADQDMSACFIDIKALSSNGHEQWLISDAIQKNFYKKMISQGFLTYSRGSFGFYHHNFSDFGYFDPNARTIRLNPGINPEENEAIVEFFESIAEKPLVSS